MELGKVRRGAHHALHAERARSMDDVDGVNDGEKLNGDGVNGEDVEGKFYQTQLTKVLEQDDFLIEEFLDENDTHYYIKFQGYNEPEWIPKENITNTIKDIMN